MNHKTRDFTITTMQERTIARKASRRQKYLNVFNAHAGYKQLTVCTWVYNAQLIVIAIITELQEQQLVACFMLSRLQCSFSLNQNNVNDYIEFTMRETVAIWQV